MRVMPSVTETIAPTLRASVTDLKFSMRCLIRSLISVALMAMCVPLCCQFVGDALEPRAQRAIDHQVAGAQHGTADERRVGLAVQPHFALEPPLERRADLASLRLVERRRRGHRDVHHALSVIFER